MGRSSEKETKYYLDETCDIEEITQSGSTTLNVSSKWLNSSHHASVNKSCSAVSTVKVSRV